MSWSLTYNGTTKSLEAWKIKNLQRTQRSQGADRVTFEIGGTDVDEAPLFSYGDTLSFKNNSTTWFTGIVIREPRFGNTTSEALKYELAGPWWYLEDLTYQQMWKVNGGDFKQKSRVILGQDMLGNSIDSGAALTDIIQYAIALERPLALGTIDPDSTIPKDENHNITCAEAIQKILRWHPDCVAYWDYSTTPHPTLHIRKRGNLSSTILDLTAGTNLSEVNITPRYDLQRSSVVIRYEVTGTTDGDAWSDITTDAWPAEATGNEIGAMVLTLPLDGGKESFIYQKVQTREIQTDVSDPTALTATTAYWKKLIPALKASSVSDIMFHDIPGETVGTKFLRALADIDDIDSNGDPLALDVSLPNELVKGSITDWMMDVSIGVEAQAQTLSAYISFNVDGQPQDPVLFSQLITATDATTRTYSKLQTFEGGEPVPTGLAHDLYDALNTLQYEGTVTLAEEECSGSTPVGKTLNIDNGRSEWGTMDALIQEVHENVDTGTTRIHFGPVEHLGGKNLLELLRVSRAGVAGRVGDGNTGAATMRATGKPAKGNSIGLSHMPVHSNTTLLGGGVNGVLPFSLSNASTSGHARVALAPGTLLPQAGSYSTPIVPKIWNGSSWTFMSTWPYVLLADTVGWHQIYLKVQYNALRYVRKAAILATTSASLPTDQLPLNTYTTSSEDTTGWTTSSGVPDNSSDCGLTYRLIGLAEVVVDSGSYYVSQIQKPQDVQSSLGLIPAAYGVSVWHQI